MSAELAAALGHNPEPAQWRATSTPPVPPALFGTDHWSTFAYIEVRTVDHRGVIAHDHMRCDPERHPMLHAAKFRGIHTSHEGVARRYPTRLADGTERSHHDDYDCLDDLLAAGLLTVAMPGHDDAGIYLDEYGRYLDIEAGFLTGYQELRLAAHARWALTDLGREVAAALRAHKAEGGTFRTFARTWSTDPASTP